MSGFGISKLGSGGTPTSGDLVYFDKLTPTTAGVIFSPNTPATSGLLYISSVDASVWIWDGIEYISYSNDAVVLAVTYSEFYSLITTSQLDIDKKYLITDYQTIYDQPDFSNYNTPKAVVSTLTGSTEPLIVTPVAVDEISNVALSTVYPNDNILYDWTFIATEIMGVSAKGRITQRTDTSNNTVSYDSRNVLYKRYDDGFGNYFIYWDNGNSSNSAVPTFSNISNCYNVNFLVTDPSLSNTNEGFLLPNSVFYSDSYDIQAGNRFYNNTFTDVTTTNLGDNCFGNLLLQSSHNVIGDSFHYNTFATGFYNNTIDVNFYSNNIAGQFSENKIGANFYNNTLNGQFRYNKVGVFFNNNTISSNSYQNNIGNSFQINTIGSLSYNFISDNFHDNIIGSNFNANTIDLNFSYNTIDDFFRSNNIGIGFSTNDVGNNFESNNIGEFFSESTVGIDFKYNNINYSFYQNIIGDAFQYNTIADEFMNNTVSTYFQANNIGLYAYSNTIATNFINNKIGDIFQNNNIASNFEGNIIENNFELNTTLGNCKFNNIGYNFNLNNLANGFWHNIIGNESNNNTVGADFKNNNIGFSFIQNTIGYNYQDNEISNYFNNNIVGFNFKRNNIGENFYNNTVGDNINDIFIQNLVNGETIASGTNTETTINGLTTGFVKNTDGILQDIPFGVASQYVRGDGTLASFPDISGGGGGQVYYCNGGTSEGTIGGNAFYQLSTGAVIGTGVDFTSGTVDNVAFANFITDIGKPTQETIPAGVWIFQCYFSASTTNTEVYATVEVYDGATFTVLATSLHEVITGNSAIDLYTFTCAVPEYTPLTTSDRIAIRFYPTNLSGSHTITLHTQDSHLSSIQTTFTTGIASLDGLTTAAQYFQTGTSGTDFNITTSGADTHVFNLPTASASNRGALSTADWNTFNGKVGGTGTTNYLPKFTASSTVGNSQIFDNGTNVGIGTSSPSYLLDVQKSTGTGNQLVGRFLAGTNTNGSAGGITLGSTQTQTGYIYGEQTASSSGDLVFGVQNLGSYAERMRILANGNVGIGTTTPTTALDVNGKTRTTTFQMTTAPSAGYVMTSDASGNGMWASSAGGLTYFTEAQSTSAPNATVNVDSLTAIASTTNADFAILPKGSGAIIAAIPDGTSVGGNKRGANAVDLQTTRNQPTHVASGAQSAVLGGYGNKATGSNDTTLGGYFNTASGSYSVACGFQSTASGTGSFAGGNGTASNNYDFAYGNACVIGSGYYANVSMGYQNTVTNGLASTVFGNGSIVNWFHQFAAGNDHRLTSGNGSAALGISTMDNGFGRSLYGRSGWVRGDTQSSKIILNRRTTDATASVLVIDSPAGNTPSVSNQITLQNNNVFRIKGSITGKQSGSTNVGVWDIDCVIVRGANAASTVIAGTPSISLVVNTGSFGAPTLTANTTLGCLTVTVTGVLATNIQWTCVIDTCEVIYA